MAVEFHLPNGEKIEKFLNFYRCQPNALAISLAWRAGLNRQEISDLTWEQVDLERRLLRLPEREVPVCEALREYLARWEKYGRTELPYVMVSRRQKKHISPQGLSRLVKDAMAEMGQPEVGFVDLRYDFIRRQLLEHDWPYVLRITGVSLTTWRYELSGLFEVKQDTAPTQDAKDEEYLVWKILQENKTGAAGIALWLVWQMRLSVAEASALTWEDIDFERGEIRLPDRTETMPRAVRDVLARERASRTEADEGHVVLSPTARKAIDPCRLESVIRDLLVRGGIESKSLRQMRSRIDGGRDKEALLSFIRERGRVTFSDVTERFAFSANKTYKLLHALAEDGSVTHLSSGYYPAEQIVPVEQHRQVVLDAARAAGGVYCGDVTELLHISKRPAQKLLADMVREGLLTLERSSKRYYGSENAE